MYARDALVTGGVGRLSAVALGTPDLPKGGSGRRVRGQSGPRILSGLVRTGAGRLRCTAGRTRAFRGSGLPCQSA